MNLGLDGLSGFLLGAQTAGANVKPDCLIALNQPGWVNVGHPAVIGAPLGMAHVMAELGRLLANIAFHLIAISFD
jgi:hypothetical protein